MTRKTLVEYTNAIRERYRRASKGGKGRILDEFCQTTEYNRKAAIRLLGRGPMSQRRHGGGRPSYGPEVREVLRRLWETADRICGKRLQPFLPELLQMLERAGELTLAPQVQAQVTGLSAATIDRLLASARLKGGRRPQTQSRAADSLRTLVPVRTFGDWRGVAPGALQADLVAHCGESTAGFYLNTLVAVDVATGWTECEPTWGLGQQRVGGALDRIRRRLPFRLRELHTDNGSEFLNRVLSPYCQRYGIRRTRGRPYKKNDQAYVEQKNWSVVRRLVGYDRYSTKRAYEQLQQLYSLLRASVNFFQPVSKLVSKQRAGAKVTKHYDRAQTPYQRLLAAGVLDDESRATLEREYRRLNPVRLRTEVEQCLEQLWKLGIRLPTPAAPAAPDRTPPVDKWTTATGKQQAQSPQVAHLPTGAAAAADPISVTDL